MPESDTKQVMLRGINDAMKALVVATSAAKKANPLAVEVPIIQKLDDIVKELGQSIIAVNRLQL